MQDKKELDFEKVNSLVTELFMKVPDLSDTRGRNYELFQILGLATQGMVMGANNIKEIENVNSEYSHELLEVYGLERLPSDDTYLNRFEAVEPETLSACFTKWVKRYLPDKDQDIYIDGKLLNGSPLTSKGECAPVIVNTFEKRSGLCTGTGYVETKKSEMTIAPHVLGKLELGKAIVGGDAAMSTPKIRKKVTGGGGHFCLPVKGNRGKCHSEILSAFEEAFSVEADTILKGVSAPEGSVVSSIYQEGGYTYFVTYEKSRCREELREYHLLTDLDGREITNCGDVEAVGLVRRTVRRPRSKRGRKSKRGSSTIKETIQTVPYIMDYKPTVEEFADFARSEWGVKNKLHYCLDCFLGEDHSTLRSDDKRYVMAILRRIVFNVFVLLNQSGEMTFPEKRIRTAHDFFLSLRIVIGDFNSRIVELGKIRVESELNRLAKVSGIPLDQWTQIHNTIIEKAAL